MEQSGRESVSMQCNCLKIAENGQVNGLSFLKSDLEHVKKNPFIISF